MTTFNLLEYHKVPGYKLGIADQKWRKHRPCPQGGKSPQGENKIRETSNCSALRVTQGVVGLKERALPLS